MCFSSIIRIRIRIASFLRSLGVLKVLSLYRRRESVSVSKCSLLYWARLLVIQGCYSASVAVILKLTSLTMSLLMKSFASKLTFLHSLGL